MAGRSMLTTMRPRDSSLSVSSGAGATGSHCTPTITDVCPKRQQSRTVCRGNGVPRSNLRLHVLSSGHGRSDAHRA